MKLLLSSVLLAFFCARSSVSSAGESAVRQRPDVSVLEGETVEITCCWTLEYETVRVIWQKNKTELTRKQMIFKNSSYGSLQNKTSNCSQLTLINVTRGDSGTYICKVIVEIPSLNEVLGNGTVLTITAKDITGSQKVLAHVLRSLPLLALIITVFSIHILVRKAQQQTPAAPQNLHTTAQRGKENEEEVERDNMEIEAVRRTKAIQKNHS